MELEHSQYHEHHHDVSREDIVAKNGLLLRDRTAFEKSRSIGAVIFDRTGTLTQGKLGVSYYYTNFLECSFSAAKEKAIEALKKEGFGVLTEIDVQATLKKKLDVDFYKYEILGACNPDFAYQALQAEDKVCIMLPCNIILQQKKEAGSVEISAVDPLASMDSIGNEKLAPIATEVQKKLRRVIDSLRV